MLWLDIAMCYTVYIVSLEDELSCTSFKNKASLVRKSLC